MMAGHLGQPGCPVVVPSLSRMTLSVPTPLGRTAPADLLARLREIEPTTTLVYVGDGTWWLGRVRPSDDPRHAKLHRQGVAMLDGMAQLDGLRGGKGRAQRMVVNALCKLAGFEWEREFRIQGEPTGDVVAWWRAQHWLETHQAEATYLAALKTSSGEDRRAEGQARVRDYVQSEAPGIHRHAFRRPLYSHT
jgi:hypothetical protein